MHNSFSAATFLLSVAQLHQLPPPDKPEVAFAGRSNSGKSSALNALCGHKGLARVSKTPGRTQLLNFFELDGEHGLRPRHGALSREAAKVGAGAAAVAGHGTNPNGASARSGLIRGRLVDLPGYGFADVPLEVKRTWGPLINGYLRGRDCLRGIVLIMDIRHPLTPFDRQMLSWAQDGARPVHILLTKSDKLSPGAARQVLKTVQKELAKQEAQPSVQLFSAQTKTGVEEARGKLASWLA